MARIHLIGNAHLDPVWLWRWQEGCNEILQTFRSALDRLQEYEDTVFTCSSAAYYEVVEKLDPEMFAQIVRRVKEGRWVPVNGWYVQPDCNLPAGESFARQALYSQRYYREKFGKICKTGYNVDSFGHNGNLPQLLLQSGLDAYVFMRPGAHENARIPNWLFRWQGVDGSRILTFRIPDSYCKGLPYPGGSAEWFDPAYADASRAAEAAGTDLMLFYGVGNHGGGPTRWDIEYIRSRQKECQVVFSDPDSYFKTVLRQNPALPEWQGELQHHASGCYALNSPIKLWNRHAENELMAAERWSTLASCTGAAEPATTAFRDAWKHLCFNQFHDILAGCCIPEAYEDARASIGYARQIAAQQQLAALLHFSRSVDTWVEGVSAPAPCEVRHCTAVESNFPAPVVVFNALACPVETLVQVPCSPAYLETVRVRDAAGKPVPCQVVRASRNDHVDHTDVLFAVQLPACGYATYWVCGSTRQQAACFVPVQCGEVAAENCLTMENEALYLKVSRETGAIVSLWNKQAKAQVFAGAAAVPLVLDDAENDAWAHNQDYFDKLIARMTPETVQWREQGPLRSAIQLQYRYKDSVLEQCIYLAAGQKQLHVACRVLWQQPHTLVKLAFPIWGQNAVDTAEIPYGFLSRKPTGEEQPAQKWVDVTAWQPEAGLQGVSILNDGKYAYSCKENELRFTVVRNALFADHYLGRENAAHRYTDDGLQLFCYEIYPHAGLVQESEAPRLAAQLNCPAVAVRESYHKGSAPQQTSFLQITPATVQLAALKLAEDASGDVILRCYETAGKPCRATVSLVGYPTTAFDVHGQEIVTLRLQKDGTVCRVNFIEDAPENAD